MYGRICGPGVESYPPRGALALRTPGWGFHTKRWCRSWEPLFSSPVCWGYRYMQGCLIRVWDLILPGWRWFHEVKIGVFTECGVVSTRRTTVVVVDLLEL